jgi:hypothetical protein
VYGKFRKHEVALDRDIQRPYEQLCKKYCSKNLQQAWGRTRKTIIFLRPLNCRYGEAQAVAASWRAHDGRRQRGTACPHLYRCTQDGWFLQPKRRPARLPRRTVPSNCICFPMSAHLSRLRLFQRHLRSLVWAWVWVWDWIHSHTPPHTRSPSSRHPPFTHYPFSPRSLVCGGQASPHKPRLVVSHSTCPPLSSSPHAHSFVLGTAVINTHTEDPGLNLKTGGGMPR